MKRLLITVFSMLLVAIFVEAQSARDCREIAHAATRPGNNVNYEIDRLKYQLEQMDVHIATKQYEAANYELRDISVILLDLRQELNVRALFVSYENSFAKAINTMNEIRTILKALTIEGQSIPPAVFARYVKEYTAKVKVVRTEMKPVLDYAK